MKNYYKISEISKLYGIGTDSLRYYERLGILRPRRDTNGYRLYSLNDMYKLNLIRDLRLLDFSMAQIKDYLDGQCIDNTLELLGQEEDFLEEQVRELTRRRATLSRRISRIREAERAETGRAALLRLPERPCVRISQHITRDEEMDFLIQRLQQKHEDRLRDFGSLYIGAFFAAEELARGCTNVYQSVFFLLEEGAGDGDFSLPGGTYLSCLYRGPYEQNGQLVDRLLSAADGAGVRPLGQPFEIYHLDNRHTLKPEEFLTEIQLQVVPDPERPSAEVLFPEKLW